jgi:Putative beta barrel porin-7 (BBP7)
MHFGTIAKRIATLLVAIPLSSPALAQTNIGAAYQSPPQFNGPPTAAPGGDAMQALYISPSGGRQQSPYVDAYGNPVILPASYNAPCCGAPYPEPCAAPYPAPMGTYPPIAEDMMDAVGVPGISSEQCGPHYFDWRAEAVYMKPDHTFDQDVDFTTLNVGGDVVLASSQLNFDWEPGFRLIGRYDVGALSVLEFGYMGIYAWDTHARFTDPNPVDQDTGNLFSLFSTYGTNPATVAVPGGPMPQTERSITQGISLESDLQTAEMSYRRYWVGYSPKISGTILAGFRYTQLDEEFHYTASGEATFDYGVITRNALAGFQTGGDIWIHLMQGVRFGSEAKVGIYNNNVKLKNAIASNPPIGADPDQFPNVAEVYRNNQPAFLTEASADLVIDFLPSWSLRAGYELMYMNSIALAGKNFNTGPPYPEVLFNPANPRTPFFAHQSDAFYHGAHLGLEYVW